MNLDTSSIQSPLALIALFVAIIELFLIYPIGKLEGRDRSLLVAFVIFYPTFIASAFFVFLWNKPVNLYTPQTLTEELQQALLPESLNVELAPDRASVAALELKLTALESKLLAVASRGGETGEQRGLGPGPAIATLSDLETLRTELLARATAAGDLSRAGFASTADALEAEEQERRNARAAKVEQELSRFRDWISSKGLVTLPPVPEVHAGSESNPDGPSIISDDVIQIGPLDRDFLVPGLYLQWVANSSGSFDLGSHGHPFLWTSSYYMATRFAGKEFPTPRLRAGLGVEESTAETVLAKIGADGFSGTYPEFFALFETLATEHGNSAVESGVVRMANEWNADSTLKSSLASVLTGMAESGADYQRARATIDEFGLNGSSVPAPPSP